MTALAQPQTDSHDPLAPLRRRNSERSMLSIALGLALALHLAALLLPLPSQTTPPPLEPSSPSPERAIHVQPIPPPDLPQPPVAAVAIAERLLPVPMPVAQDQEPVVEPILAPLPEPLAASLPEIGDFAQPPPQDSEIIPEGTAGLILPRLISKCGEPVYPAAAIRARLEGVVVLRALITKQGEVTSIELFDAPRPDLGFSRSAIAALSCWKYEPGRYRDRPVAVFMTVIVEFELD